MFEKELERIIEIARRNEHKPHFVEEADDIYFINGLGQKELIKHVKVYPRQKTVYGLDMFCKLIKTEWTADRQSFVDGKENDGIDAADMLMIDVQGHNLVSAYTQMFKDDENDFVRLNLYQAEERSMPGIPNGYLDFDEARIRFNASFDLTEDLDYVLNLLSNVVRGENAEIKDNGVTQVVKVNKGVQMLAMEAVRPIVKLKPYRTFPEICQPESNFLLRIKDDKVGLFEADGGMWKQEAKLSIKRYLERELKDQIEAGVVVVGM